MSIDTPDSAHSATSNSLRGTSLSASLTVNDLAKSVAWYSDVVGFTVEQRHERDGVLQAVSLRAGVAKIVLGRDDGARGVNRMKGEGFSLMITTTDDIDELAARIKQRGGVLESGPMDTRWGARVFRVHDPDGFKLTISSEY